MSLALPSSGMPHWPDLPGRQALAEQLLVLRRRWRLLAVSAILVPGMAALVMYSMPARYTATGILLYDPQGAAPPGDAQSADAPEEEALVASQSAIITSLPAARVIAAQLDLAGRPEFTPSPRWHFWPGWKAKHAPGVDDVALAVRRDMDVSVPDNSRLLAVSFTSADPALAATAANLAMQIYLNHQRDDAFDDLNGAETWIQGHATILQGQLEQTEAQLAQARAAAGVVPGALASITSESLSRLAASLVDAQANLAMDQSRLAAASAGDAADANAAIAPNLLPLRKEQADLSAQVQALSGEYGADYPDLVSARAQLAAISDEINAETGRELDAARAQVAADRAEIATLSAALATAQGHSQSEDAESAPIRVLEQREAASQAMLQQMTIQAGQLAQDTALTKPDARVLSAAVPPESPSSPQIALVLAAAGTLGICLGLLLAGLAEALDTSLRSGAGVRAETGLPCLALIPETKHAEAAALDEPFSLFAEQLRALRTGLALQGGPKIFAITAARPGEGKTTMTIALGRALAASGLIVLVIDGDIRQPSFDTAFLTGNDAGLTDHLAGLASLPSVLQQDCRSSLQVMTAGTQGQDALSLFLSPAMPAMLEALRGRFDVVLLDVPPALALAEARVLAGMADGTLLCVRWGSTPARVVRAAVEKLRESKANLAGAVLTRVSPVAHGRSGFADAEMYHPRYGGYFSASVR
jgi:capsular exopolysaccharide synthesis family protein